MPISHIPFKGGAHAQPRRAPTGTGEGGGDCVSCREKSAELDRLRQELARAQNEGATRRAGGAGMMWTALGICGIALIFALAAVLRHG